MAATLPNSTGLLDINGCIPQNVIMDTEVVTPMFTEAFATVIGLNVDT